MGRRGGVSSGGPDLSSGGDDPRGGGRTELGVDETLHLPCVSAINVDRGGISGATSVANPCSLRSNESSHLIRGGHANVGNVPLALHRVGCTFQCQVDLVEFVDLASKMHVKRNSWRIRTWDEESVVSFDHALSVEQRRIRAAQWPKIKDAKQKGLRWFWSDVVPHRLIVSGEGRLKVDWLGDNEAAWPC